MKRFSSLLLSIMLLTGVTTMAHAGKPAVSVKQAISTVKGHVAGKILSNDLAKKGSVPAYRIKVLTDKGVVKIIFVDAETGKIL
jgi:uncharacterized membrane protein YkoI